MPYRAVGAKSLQDWRELAIIFEQLFGGTPNGRKAGAYLRNLADCSLPVNELPHLRWHEEAPVIEVMPQARQEPHPVVLATLAPSVPLRAVWRRGR